MVKERCWNLCWNPLLEPPCALEPCARTLLEPLFCVTPLCALEPLLEPTFVHFWSFLRVQHSVWPLTT